MNRRYIVLDTNCLLQILGVHSKYHHLWDRFMDEEYILCFSTEILFEYEEILKQKASKTVAEMFLKVIAHSENVFRKDPFYRLELIESDPDDNKFVDCAFACQADFIVSDDSHFDVLSQIPFPRIQVKRLEEFSAEFE
ncbi:MAG: putative toxin-antitoxin system toxin component, PIN family [Bacteroidaceae bacterium]|nr:putative toxin-antitoxin system toxin component, PIN family [Bacteroidaceae bacterium]